MSDVLEITVRVRRIHISPAGMRALRDADTFDWILFTSANAVVFFVQELRKRRVPFPLHPKIAVVGPRTAQALRQTGRPVHVIPDSFSGSHLVRTLVSVKGKRILFPRSAIAAGGSVTVLRERGAIVRIVPLYTTEGIRLPQKTKQKLLQGKYQTLIFKSPSGVRGLMGQLNAREKQVVRTIRARCIGGTTAAEARHLGFQNIAIGGIL